MPNPPVAITQQLCITGPDGATYSKGVFDDPPDFLVRMAENKETVANPVTGEPERRVMFLREIKDGVVDTRMTTGAERSVRYRPPAGSLPPDVRWPDVSESVPQPPKLAAKPKLPGEPNAEDIL